MIFTKVFTAAAFSALLVAPSFAAPANGSQGFGGNRGGDGGNRGNKGISGSTSATVAATATQAASSGASNAQATGTATTNNNAGNSGGNAGGNGANALALNPANLQTGSESNGIAASGAEAGQAPAATDAANFINFCTGKTITNGLQVKGGSCNGIVMGDIPASTNMISAIITNPTPGGTIEADQTFNISVQMQNLVAGSFTNPDVTYYSSPQELQGGKVVGHTHVTVQPLGNSLTPSTPPDPATFAFFKGINDAGNGNGLLQAVVTGGLPAGSYRVCTMTSSSNHQPVLMPVAQRGAQDDCTKFTVGGGGGGNGSNAGNTGNTGATGNTGSAGNTGATSSTGAAGSTIATESSTATGSTATGSSTANKGGSGRNKGGAGTNKGSTGKGKF
ncbi:hypothetical protein MMC25_001376 [Agyrium rufum]|nr:hypothetical protein [Agyrium rufum]